MSPEYTPDSIAMIVRCLRVQKGGPGPICPVCVHQAGLVVWENGENRITDAGRVVLAIAAERDLLRLRCAWQEAEVKRLARIIAAQMLQEQRALDGLVISPTVRAVISESIAEAEAERDAARAAYVAAGGVV